MVYVLVECFMHETVSGLHVTLASSVTVAVANKEIGQKSLLIGA